MPLTVEDVTRDGTSDLDALDKVRRAESLLAEIAPVHARWVERFVRSFTVMDLRSNPFLVRKRGILFGAERLAKSSPSALALTFVNAAVSCRLKRFERRLRSADQRAQYWRRVRKEVV